MEAVGEPEAVGATRALEGVVKQGVSFAMAEE